MSLGTTRGATLSVGIALFLLFAGTLFLNRGYRAIRRSRAEDRYRSGLTFVRQGHDHLAAEEFRAALAYSHDNPTYRLQLAQSLMHLGEWGEAESHLTDLQQDDPTNGPINLMLARIAARERRDQQAEIDYNRAIYGYWPDDRDENRTSARFELVGLFDRDHEQKQALGELLQLAGEVSESDFTTREKIARMLLSHGSPQSAADLYRRLIALQPRSADAEKGLGEAEFALGDYTGARNSFRAAARLKPSERDLKQRVADCDAILDLDPTLVRLSARQRFERAQVLLRQVLDSAGQCTAVGEDLVGAAQKALTGKFRRMRDGDTVAALALSQEIWKLESVSCPQAQAGPVLTAVISKLLKQ